jgi:hypothetical protein
MALYIYISVCKLQLFAILEICTNSCSGHGECLSMRTAALFFGQTSAALSPTEYSNWEGDGSHLCNCDWGFSGPDCSISMLASVSFIVVCATHLLISSGLCPKGDIVSTASEPVYRKINISVSSSTNVALVNPSTHTHLDFPDVQSKNAIFTERDDCDEVQWENIWTILRYPSD